VDDRSIATGSGDDGEESNEPAKRDAARHKPPPRSPAGAVTTPSTAAATGFRTLTAYGARN